LGSDTGRFKRSASFHVNESRVNKELAAYVKNHFNKKDPTVREVLSAIVKRSIKSTLAVASLWVPGLSDILSCKDGDPVSYVYSNLLDKFKKPSSSSPRA
jgi:hypothetical protein